MICILFNLDSAGCTQHWWLNADDTYLGWHNCKLPCWYAKIFSSTFLVKVYHDWLKSKMLSIPFNSIKFKSDHNPSRTESFRLANVILLMTRQVLARIFLPLDKIMCGSFIIYEGQIIHFLFLNYGDVLTNDVGFRYLSRGGRFENRTVSTLEEVWIVKSYVETFERFNSISYLIYI